MYIRTDRWLLDPMRLWPILFGTQALLWYFGFPARPTIPAAAPRFFSNTAAVRYVVLFGCLIVGLFIGRVIGRIVHQVRPRRPRINVQLWRRIALFALLLSAFGELMYIRPVLRDPSLLSRGVTSGEFALASLVINMQQVTGITSLTNLYLVPVAIYAFLAFHPAMTRRGQGLYIRRLVIIGLVVVGHSILLSARMFAVYFFAIIGAAYLFERPVKAIRLRYIIVVVTAVAAIIWGGATLRDGGRRKAATGFGYLHPDTQRYVRDTLMQGYLGADFNNTMVRLNCRPMGQYVATTMFATIWLKLGHTFDDTSFCYPEEVSGFGTMNTLALWWLDLGWLAALVAVVVGAWSSFLYALAARTPSAGASVLFLLTYPGIHSSIRINYFFLTIYLLPLAFVCVPLLLRKLVRELEPRRVLPSSQGRVTLIDA